MAVPVDLGNWVAKTGYKPPKKTPEQETQDRLAKLEKDVSRQDRRSRAMLKLGQFQAEFNSRTASWMTAAKDIGSAYKSAYDVHNKVVADQASSDALELQIVFSVLSVATVGGLSWVSSFVQNGKHPVLAAIAEAVEDSAQAAADKVIGTVGPLVYPSNLSGGVNPDPQIFQNELEKKIYDVQQAAYSGFGKIYKAWESAPLDTWDNYVEAQQMAAHQEWRNKADRLLGADQLPKVQEMANELETGLWAKYILEQHSHREIPVVGWRISDESYDYVGDKIYRHLIKLNITRAAGLPAKTPDWSHDTAQAINNLVKWAKEHKVRDFVSMRFPTRPR